MQRRVIKSGALVDVVPTVRNRQLVWRDVESGVIYEWADIAENTPKTESQHSSRTDIKIPVNIQVGGRISRTNRLS